MSNSTKWASVRTLDKRGKYDRWQTHLGYLVDAEAAILTKVAEIDGTSYPGVAEHEGQLWVTYASGDAAKLSLAKADVPG